MKSNVAIIGAGRVSYSLASALSKSGYNIVSIVSRNIHSAKALAKKFRLNHFSNSLNSISKSASIFFLSVPDEQITLVASELSKLNLNFNQTL
jgi:glutamyl-tRNA reductase